MSKFKKTIAFVIAIAIILPTSILFASCGKQTVEEGTQTETSVPNTENKLPAVVGPLTESQISLVLTKIEEYYNMLVSDIEPESPTSHESGILPASIQTTDISDQIEDYEGGSFTFLTEDLFAQIISNKTSDGYIINRSEIELCEYTYNGMTHKAEFHKIFADDKNRVNFEIANISFKIEGNIITKRDNLITKVVVDFDFETNILKSYKAIIYQEASMVNGGELFLIDFNFATQVMTIHNFVVTASEPDMIERDSFADFVSSFKLSDDKLKEFIDNRMGNDEVIRSYQFTFNKKTITKILITTILKDESKIDIKDIPYVKEIFTQYADIITSIKFS